MDNTVLKATLLCVWKGVFYSTTMAFVLFYIRFYSIAVALFLLLLAILRCCCCCCCCYTVQYCCVCCCCCCTVVRDHRCYFPRTYCWFVVSSSLSSLVATATATTAAELYLMLPLLLPLPLLLLYRATVLIWFDSIHSRFTNPSLVAVIK